ncbi:glutamine amidotransferase [Helicobacter didelphidarum]|uniref:Glutamine amidotransferase n=1 Tax=Helicobacter didelphidarum TaxID=2040648 RepID=A0A3D8IR51_9HELI|nr:aminodeoxychorismate/anthranilate synthase component II [Helicobacter didelphidarum]RDU67081.1 glutamine amidotransferase [Helicobacter didelphidarum]
MKHKSYKTKQVLMIDNYDSFTYNIIYLLRELGIQPIILQNDCSLEDILSYDFSHLCISPGPSHPIDAGISLEAIKYFAPSKKILGICLGHQCIAHAFGGEVSRMSFPTHGKTSLLHFEPNILFKDIHSPIQIALYHSLHVSNLGACEALGYSTEGIIMALKVKGYDTYGVQFHPESILQHKGKKILKNFLEI